MTPFNSITIYYFTGTGNSGKVAEWFAETANQNNIKTELINIGEINRRYSTPPNPESLIVFISPIHGFNYPPAMLHYLWRFPKGKNKVILMNTRAGMRIGKLITPGLTGVAFILGWLFLMIKGYRIKGMRPVDMPSNWISVHPGLNQRAIKYLHIRNRKRVVAFAEKVLSGKSSFKALLEIVQDIAVAPIAVLYYLFGRFFLAKSYYASKDCNNCGLCIKKCPVKAIKWVNNRPFWTLDCESCMKCMSNCPKLAIETAHGSLTVFFIIYSGILVGLFYKYFELFFFQIANPIIPIIIKWVIPIFFVFLWYRLTHFLLRFRLFERLMVYTSLTKYKFWGRRYKALNDKDFE
ncbi:MAG: EFR1 family ferrodoxin [Salinivirgaceae bacterium]|jgi:ferredoxin|nr:EFR1 family ferrodoxin [Salinivirgaceae bacterium]